MTRASCRRLLAALTRPLGPPAASGFGARLLRRWRAAEPPAWLMALVTVAILVLPGGIPMVLVGTPLYLRRRERAVMARRGEARHPSAEAYGLGLPTG